MPMHVSDKLVEFEFVVDGLPVVSGTFPIPMYAKAPDPNAEAVEIRCDHSEVKARVVAAAEAVVELLRRSF